MPPPSTSVGATTSLTASSAQSHAGNNWVSLNVGGKLFTTTRATLCADQDSQLYAMFREDSQWHIDRDENGRVLVDCDGDYFGPILNFLRFNDVVIPPDVNPRGVLAAAEYLGIRGVVNYFNRDKRQIIFSWGSGGSGELGTLDKCDVLTPTPVTIVPYNSRVTEVALGANYSCILTTTGCVFSFGNGDWGQLGLGSPKNFHEKAEDKTPVVTVPTQVRSLASKRVMSIATGYAYAMALTSDHEVYFWGNNNHGQSGLGVNYFGAAFRKIEEPVLVETLQGKDIIQLGCGSFFVLALSASGTVYSWGLVDCVGLGTLDKIKSTFDPDEIAESVSKDKRTVLLKPRVLKVPSESRVVRINAGQWHSCAITETGELFTWGVGYQGRLGHGDKEACYVPTKVTGELEGKKVIDVACGSFHTVALTADGGVYCWGDNANGQCGSAMLPEAVTRPHCVTSLNVVGGGTARSVSCGRQHTAVVMNGPHQLCTNHCCRLRHDGKPEADHGQVYVFGESKGMGLGSFQRVCSAKLVPGMEQYNVSSVVSGLHHTFVLAEVVSDGSDKRSV
jgi:alpha-tubulin suppressor-like RCC1 family protein